MSLLSVMAESTLPVLYRGLYQIPCCHYAKALDTSYLATPFGIAYTLCHTSNDFSLCKDILCQTHDVYEIVTIVTSHIIRQ